MAQSYKIFINEVPVILLSGAMPEGADKNTDAYLCYTSDRKKEIEKALNLIENSAGIKSLTVYGEDAKSIKAEIFSGYKKVRAAGGLVFNKHDEILMLFRRSMWDLPKGKIDPGERKKVAALREVREETGVQKLSIIKKLKKTYHTYRLENNTRVLKVTYWYLMLSSDTNEPVPQAEEDIELAKWVSVDNLEEKLKQTYANIYEVITNGISVMHLG